MIKLIIVMIIIWLGGLSVAIHIIDNRLNNQMKLLFLLRDEMNGKIGKELKSDDVE